jgi:hypothetical protein
LLPTLVKLVRAGGKEELQANDTIKLSLPCSLTYTWNKVTANRIWRGHDVYNLQDWTMPFPISPYGDMVGLQIPVLPLVS